MERNNFLEWRSFAGQVARAGESGIKAISYINRDTVSIHGGIFVAREGVGGCRKITSASDHILGVTVVMGVHHEFKPGKNLSAMSIGHGDEICVQIAEESALKDGDAVKIVASGPDAGKISDTGTITTQLYVSGLNGKLAKIMRNEVAV